MEEHGTVYFSKSSWPFNETDFSLLLQQSRRYNQLVNISGILLYVRGSIIQVLEGEKKMVLLDEDQNAAVRTKPDEPIVMRLINVFYDANHHN